MQKDSGVKGNNAVTHLRTRGKIKQVAEGLRGRAELNAHNKEK